MRKWQARGGLVLALSAVLGGCQPSLAPETPPREKVLILGAPKFPVISQASAEIQRRNEGLPDPAQRLGVEIREVSTELETDAELRRLMPGAGRYRAVFTNSQTIARVTQLLMPGKPIVFDGVDDPVANCLVDSLAHPGRNATGYMHLLPETEAKMLELLHDGFPDLQQVVVLAAGSNYTPAACATQSPPEEAAEPPCTPGWHATDDYLHRLIDVDAIEAQARRLGQSTRYLVLCEPQDFERVAALSGARGTGVLVPWQSLFVDNVDDLVSRLRAAGRPAVGPNQAFAAAGGLMALEPILDRGRDRASVLALMQVLDGREPAHLPVQGPRGFEVTFNAATSHDLGLRPHRMLLLRADRILP